MAWPRKGGLIVERFHGTIYGSDGNAVSGVSITVRKAGTGLAAELFADKDGVTTKTNPFTNDSNGSYEFYTAYNRIDIIPSKTGLTFVADDFADIIMHDPGDDRAVRCVNEFMAPFVTGSDVIVDGNHWRIASGTVTRVVGDSTYRNGWIDVLESGGAQGGFAMCENANSLALLFVPTTDVFYLDMRVEKVGDAVAGTRRVGLGSATLSTGDPTNGIYIRQIDANNAFLVCRSGGSENTRDLGFTLNNPRRIRVTITTGSVQAFIENDSGVMVSTAAVTLTIPTAILGLSVGGGATGSAAGIRLDYLNVYNAVRI